MMSSTLLRTFNRNHRTARTKLCSKLSTLCESYQTILVSREDGDGLGVGIITLNQPKTLNALSDAVFDDLIHASKAFDNMDDIGSIVITGRGKAFAAGADIEEMSTKNFAHVYKSNMFSQWAELSKVSKPTIAAVNGYALGGGCELAMMCDIILASSNAKFSQPEINLGIIPGAGGTQRLIRAVGKAKAMEMILTGKMIDASQAEKDGLISRVVEEEEDRDNSLLDEAVKVGLVIGTKGQIAVRMAKETVNAANEMSLEEGLRFERRMFHSLFATKDQKEGMSSFLNKQKPEFIHE